MARRWDAFAGRLATASAVVTETMCLLGQSPSGPRALAKLVADSGMEVFDFCRETSPEP